PGQILVAESTRYVAGRIELRKADGGGVVEYVDRGLHPLKGFPEPKRLFEVIWHPAGLDEQLSSDGAGAAAGEAEIAAATTAARRASRALWRVVGSTPTGGPALPS